MAFTIKTQRNVPLGRPLVRQWYHQQRATATPPATTTQTLFTVANGNILVHLMMGEVTTVIQSQACNLKVTLAPTTGTAGDVASNLDINADEAGTFYLVEGDGTALVGVSAGGSFFAAGTPVPFVVAPGVIRIETSATNTGSIEWNLWYEPLDEDAVVTVN